MHADRVDAADAVDLDQVALDAWHHGPDVQEGQDGEEDSPDQCQGDADQRRQQPVAPILGDSEGGEARFPHTVEAVGPCRLGDNILKVHLRKKISRKMLSETFSGLDFHIIKPTLSLFDELN